MAGAATVTAPALARALDLITRVRGVRGAMVVSRSDGLVVAEQLMEGIKGSAVAALASSLAGRLQRAMVSAGLGPSQFWHLQCDHGALLVVSAGTEAGLLLVAVTEADVNVGLVRLELLRAAETAP
jgi:predicted regulator of Ras-like GTPase activity (Roadblock/LC7/MglB family)